MAHEIMINFKFNERKKPEIVEEVVKENEPISTENAEYEELIAKMQAEVDESEKKIKELDAKLKEQNTTTGTNKKPDLNNLLYEQLLDRVEAMFENPKDATPARVQELRNEIAAFLDSEFADPEAQKTLKKQYDQLNKSQDAPSVLVKGGIALERKTTQGDYSTISIVITDKATNETIATYTPNSKTGKYLFILSPGRKYVITVTNTGFKTYSEDFSPVDSEESYEMNKEIRLKEK